MIPLAVVLSVTGCGGDDGGGGGDGDGGESFCSINERLEDSAAIDLVFSGDVEPAQVKTSMEAMVSDLDALRRAAPPEVSAEVTRVADGFTAIADYLEANGYDPASIGEPGFESVVSAFDTPEFDAATDALDAYTAANCVQTS
jgi:hypothetical protein